MSSRKHIHAPANVGEHIADSVTAFVGSWLCIGLHAIWFALWIALHVEPFPYGLLTMIVSLEAIFLSTLVMISQNRQSEKDRKRDTIESDEVQQLFDGHQLLLQINRQQVDILNKQTETLQFLKGDSSEETKVCNDRQAEKRSNSPIGRSGKDEERTRSKANEIDTSLSSYLAQMPGHPLAREIQAWVSTMGKTPKDVVCWEINAGQPFPHRWKAHISLKFAENPTKHDYWFEYSDLELLEGGK